MAEISIVINGRSYDISCDNGQEDRVRHLAMHIDQKLRQIAGSGGAYNESHLFALTALVLADELFDAKEALASAASRPQPVAARKQPVEPVVAVGRADEQAISQAIEHLVRRIDGISAKVEAA